MLWRRGNKGEEWVINFSMHMIYDRTLGPFNKTSEAMPKLAFLGRGVEVS